MPFSRLASNGAAPQALKVLAPNARCFARKASTSTSSRLAGPVSPGLHQGCPFLPGGRTPRGPGTLGAHLPPCALSPASFTEEPRRLWARACILGPPEPTAGGAVSAAPLRGWDGFQERPPERRIWPRPGYLPADAHRICGEAVLAGRKKTCDFAAHSSCFNCGRGSSVRRCLP